MNWYLFRVQSNREDSVADALRRRVKSEELDHCFGEICVPIEKVTEVNPKTKKKRVIKRKRRPGCILVQMVSNDDSWRLIHDTRGIDLTGAVGKPEPLLAHEVDELVGQPQNPDVPAPKVVIGFRPGSK